MMIDEKPRTIEEEILWKKKETTERNLVDMDLDEFHEMLEDFKEFYVAGMELQLYYIMRDTGWSREKVFETLITKGSISGFPILDLEVGDPFDLENWMKNVRSINDILGDVEYKLGEHDQIDDNDDSKD
jgi:hypothetical protein